jgi:cyclopropane-fatty-acyl-phospholipid synthase
MKRERSAFLGISARSGAAESALAAPSPSVVFGIESWLVQRLAAAVGNPDIRIALWDGSELLPAGHAARPVDTLRVRDRGALWRLVSNPELWFGDDYATGRLDVEGDLPRFLETVFLAGPENAASPSPGSLRQRLYRGRPNDPAGSQQNIHHHYDLSNDFYRLWLDDSMAYTCAYFAAPDVPLAAAQTAKMDHICRKLRLRAGEAVVEAGCGWGGLARHMARHYGVHVRAYNISAEQVRYARERSRAEGLGHLVEYVQEDYREIRGRYDAFVSVGMLEHVGIDHYRTLGAVIDRCLTANGRGLIHSIGKNRAAPMTPWIERRIFPGAYTPTLCEMAQILEPSGQSVLDVENLRLHYALTLEHWLARFEQQRERIAGQFDEVFVRAWRFYLASSIASFRSGGLQLFQLLFARPRRNDLPWTRAHLYGGDHGAV